MRKEIKLTRRITASVLALLLAVGMALSCAPDVQAAETGISSASFFYWVYENYGDESAYDAYTLLTTGKYGSVDIRYEKSGEFYAATSLGADGDATSFDNLVATVQWLEECNALRTTDDVFPGCSALKVNMLLMAMAEIDTNWSRNNITHAEVFGDIGENLAWNYSDPFDGWYTKEKAIYVSGGSGTTGHYENICRSTYGTTGFAVTTIKGKYSITHGQTFALSSNSKYSTGYTVAEFSALLSAYAAAVETGSTGAAGNADSAYQISWDGSSVYTNYTQAIQTTENAAEGKAVYVWLNGTGGTADGWYTDASGNIAYYGGDGQYFDITGGDALDGISYDAATNTLTLSNFNHPEAVFYIREMDSNFTIELVGENHVQCILAFPYGFELTGSGILIVGETQQYAEITEPGGDDWTFVYGIEIMCYTGSRYTSAFAATGMDSVDFADNTNLIIGSDAILQIYGSPDDTNRCIYIESVSGYGVLYKGSLYTPVEVGFSASGEYYAGTAGFLLFGPAQ